MSSVEVHVVIGQVSLWFRLTLWPFERHRGHKLEDTMFFSNSLIIHMSFVVIQGLLSPLLTISFNYLLGTNVLDLHFYKVQVIQVLMK